MNQLFMSQENRNYLCPKKIENYRFGLIEGQKQNLPGTTYITYPWVIVQSWTDILIHSWFTKDIEKFILGITIINGF